MTHLRRLMAAVLVLALAAACSDDDNGPTSPDQGPMISGQVQNLIYEGRPVPGIAVAADDTTISVSGADGSYVLEGVEGTYSLVAASPIPNLDEQLFTGYAGVTADPSPLGALPGGFNDANPRALADRSDRTALPRTSTYTSDAALVSGSISGADGAGESIRVAIGDGERGNSRGYSAAATSYNDLSFSWPAASSRTVTVAALQRDSSGEFLFDQQAGVTLARNSTGNTVDLSLSTVSGGRDSIEVSADAPTGMTLSSEDWSVYVRVGDLLIWSDSATGNPATLHVPLISGASYLVLGDANIDDGSGNVGTAVVSRANVSAGATVDVTYSALPALDTPTDLTTGVSVHRPAFAFTPPTDAVMNTLILFGNDPYGGATQEWLTLAPGDTTEVELPTSTGIDAVLHPASGYDWSIYSITEGNITAGNWLLFVNALTFPEIDYSIAMTDKMMVTAPSRTFQTGETP